MAKNKKDMDTLIGVGMRIIGDIKFSGVLYVHGEIEGNIKSEPDKNTQLILAAGGKIKGNVEAKHIILHGFVEGDVKALDKLEITASSEVIGDLNYVELLMEAGARVQGKLVYNDPKAMLAIEAQSSADEGSEPTEDEGEAAAADETEGKPKS